MKMSMAGRATLWLGGIALLGVLVTSLARSFIDTAWLAGVVAALILVPLAAWSGGRLVAPLEPDDARARRCA